MTTTELQARQYLADLHDKRAALELHKQECQERADALSFDALAIGDDKARAKLTKVHREIIEIDAELASFAAAIREGEQRIEIARGVARTELERRNGDAALRLGRELLDAAKAADQGLAQAFAALNTMRSTVADLNKIGCGPNLALVDVNLKRALVTASMGSGYQLGHTPPSERHSVGELGATWSKHIHSWAAQRLEPAKEAA